ncbi:nuclear transport factor 2 family protein [Halonotius terrestris]|uniref:Nuclear transport factor 2 family protein n=1 Tax=Halonotius terrestris TaxID=2487750 RepID=A0A8J8PC91_9EURY|nr:nuclear transport factor 2 family protein [Halonotius terrestris]TQQ82588.1 nuclear transport factor 2 family protein [Halonotius terrestris]
MERADRVSEYYRCLDDDEYDTLCSLLDPDFVQRRPDRSFDDREAFVSFMADERPVTDTTHEVVALCESTAGLAAYGELRGPDGDTLFEFIDVFQFAADGRIAALDTYS